MAKQQAQGGTVAVLNSNNVLDHYEVITAGKLKLARAKLAADPMAPGRVPVPDECDLVPGQYVWVGDPNAPGLGAFLPLDEIDPILHTPDDIGVDIREAIAAFMVQAAEQGMRLPALTVLWLEHWEGSIDRSNGVKLRDAYGTGGELGELGVITEHEGGQ